MSHRAQHTPSPKGNVLTLAKKLCALSIRDAHTGQPEPLIDALDNVLKIVKKGGEQDGDEAPRMQDYYVDQGPDEMWFTFEQMRGKLTKLIDVLKTIPDSSILSSSQANTLQGEVESVLHAICSNAKMHEFVIKQLPDRGASLDSNAHIEEYVKDWEAALKKATRIESILINKMHRG